MNSLTSLRRRRDALRQRLKTKAAYPGRDEDLAIVRDLDAEISWSNQLVGNDRKQLEIDDGYGTN